MGLEPLYMGNEGKLIAFVPQEEAERALAILRKSAYGANAARIGTVEAGEPGLAYLSTAIGGKRIIDVLYGEGLPRIC
jgi:hydrogenase expression/formation protein HypE